MRFNTFAYFFQFKFVDTDSIVRDGAVNFGERTPVKVVFTPARPGWESAKLVIKIKAEKGPTLKTSVGLNGFGGFPALALTRNGQPVDHGEVLQLGLVKLGETVSAFEVTNSGDAAGFASLRLFEDPYQERPVEEAVIIPDKVVLAPGQTKSLTLKVDPAKATVARRSVFMIAYVGGEMGRQVNSAIRALKTAIFFVHFGQAPIQQLVSVALDSSVEFDSGQ